MKCREFEEHITTFIEGTLLGTLLRDMEEHRASCEKCARQLELQRFIYVSLNDTKPVKAPEGFASRILAAVESEVPDNVVEFIPATSSPVSAEAPGTTPIDCRIFEGQVAAFVDGSLKDGLFRRMEEHRAYCPSCERLVNVHKVVLASLNTAEPVPAPAGLAERILAAVAETEKVFSFKRFRSLSPVFAAAGLLTAAAFILVAGISKHIPILGSFPIFDALAIKLETIWAQIVTGVMAVKVYAATQIIMPSPGKIAVLFEPVQIPYMSTAVPPYFFAALLFLSWYALSYFNKPVVSEDMLV